MFHCCDCDGQGVIFAGCGAGYYPWDVEDIFDPCPVCQGKGKTWRFWRFPLWVLVDQIKSRFAVVHEEEDIPF